MRLHIFSFAIALSLSALACQSHTNTQPQWYKGNLHAHSLWSDGDEFPEVVAEWYRANGYHFFCLSDHNVFQTGDRWLDQPALNKKNAQPALNRYLGRLLWPAKTRGQPSHDAFAVRLRTFNEIAAKLNAPERFLLIPGEEISDSFLGHPVHLNAFNISQTITPQRGQSIIHTIDNNIAVLPQTAASNTLVTLNHPNFGYAINARQLADSNARVFELYNAHPSVNHLGNSTHPSVERLWDLANTIRIAHLKRPPLFATAADDAHNYHTVAINKANPGRAWIMVRANSLSIPQILSSISAGHFYSSSGVTLYDIRASSNKLQLDIAPDPGAVYTTQFIGTLANNLDHVGIVLATVVGLHPTYSFKGNELYVRAVVTSSRSPKRPAYPGQLQQAWTQPVTPSQLASSPSHNLNPKP